MRRATYGSILICVSVTLMLCMPACSGDDAASADAGGAPRDASTMDAARDAAAALDAGVDSALRVDAGRDAGTDAGASTDAGIATDSGRDAGHPARLVTCADAPPAGAPLPDPPPAYSGGTCPALAPGTNTIRTSGRDRTFLLIVPTDLMPGETPGVAFLWHWLGGNAAGFRDRAMVQDAVNRFRFIAVIPEARGDLSFKWPYLTGDPGCAFDLTCNCDCRFDQELRFFDDMLACVTRAYTVNTSCVSSVGVSAGALWTAQLAAARSTHLSSMLVLSGGTGTGAPSLDPATTVRPWAGAAHHMPALVLWGGALDFCFLFFESTSQRLEAALAADGHFVEECIHNCMHSVPPFEAAPGGGQFDVWWDFVMKHPYWLDDGESPYLVSGLPAGTPDWCAIGVGAATPRVGACPGTTFLLGSCR